MRETSLVFTSPTIGVTLIPCDSPGEPPPPPSTHTHLTLHGLVGTPAVVGFIQNSEACSHLMAGDIVSKINGAGTSSLTFNGDYWVSLLCVYDYIYNNIIIIVILSLLMYQIYSTEFRNLSVYVCISPGLNCLCTLVGVVRMLKHLPRPIVVHFVQVSQSTSAINIYHHHTI